METSQGLGLLERVELKEAWELEGDHFTSWLGEHISLLGEALGLHLESMPSGASEEDLQGYVAAWDVENDRPVIIQSRLEPSEHSHFGELLACAAVHDADVVIWVAKEFKSEHKEALEMLNRRTDEDTEFYGVAVELWRIDGSRPAPYFHVVASPSEWASEWEGELIGISPSSNEEGDEEADDQSGAWEEEERYHWFWEPLKQKLEDAGLSLRSGNGQGYHCPVNLGVSDVWCDMRFTDSNEVAVDLKLHENGNWDDSHLELLMESQLEIEAEMGMDLAWDGTDDHGDWSVSVSAGGSIDEPPHRLDEIRDWMFENVVRFNEVFPRHLLKVRHQLSQEETVEVPEGSYEGIFDAEEPEPETDFSWAFGAVGSYDSVESDVAPEPVFSHEPVAPAASFESADSYEPAEPVIASEATGPVSSYGAVESYEPPNPEHSYGVVEPVSSYETSETGEPQESSEPGDSFGVVRSYGSIESSYDTTEVTGYYRVVDPSENYGPVGSYGVADSYESTPPATTEEE